LGRRGADRQPDECAARLLSCRPPPGRAPSRRGRGGRSQRNVLANWHPQRCMRPEDKRSFGADDPVARYWLHNCVGFRVPAVGVVDATAAEGGVRPLEVRRLGGMGWTTHVSAERVESIAPWTETIALAVQRRPPREEPHVATKAAASLALLTAAVARSFFALL